MKRNDNYMIFMVQIMININHIIKVKFLKLNH